MGKRTEHDMKRGWGKGKPDSIYTHRFEQVAGDKPSERVSACGQVFFAGWCRGFMAGDPGRPANACPKCKSRGAP